MTPLIPPRREFKEWGLRYDGDEFVQGFHFRTRLEADNYIINKIGVKVLTGGKHVLIDDNRNELRVSGYRLGGWNMTDALIEKLKISSARKRMTR